MVSTMITQNKPRLDVTCRLEPAVSDNELLESPITIPDEDKSAKFSFRKLWAFSGPGFIMSIAFLDPGNIEADLQSSTYARYQLFWVLLWSTVLGLLIQRLTARVGTITGRHLAQICYTEYKKGPRLALWIMLEIAIIGSDMQEVIGTALAIYLLSSGKVPLWGGVIITVADTLTIAFLDRYGLRKLELFFTILIAVMAVSFGYEFIKMSPGVSEIAKGIAIPECTNCMSDTSKVLLAIGIVGSCITPYNLYLHSGLVTTRQIDRKSNEKISEANFYYLVESGIALFVSFFINIFVMSVFAEGLSGETNVNVRELCYESESPYADDFPNNTQAVDVDLYKAGVYLGCRFGQPALYIWAIGLLAAGQSSTMTGCYAGQFTMEGFLNLTWVRWKRVLLTRSIAVLPSFFVAYFSSMEEFNGVNDFLNALMSIQLPFAILPAIAFSSNRRIVGEFANGLTQKCLTCSIFLLIFAGNTVLVAEFVNGIEDTRLLIAIGIYFAIYVTMCVYLALHCMAALTDPHSFLNSNIYMRRYILGKSITEYYDKMEKSDFKGEKRAGLESVVQNGTGTIKRPRASLTDNPGPTVKPKKSNLSASLPKKRF